MHERRKRLSESWEQLLKFNELKKEIGATKSKPDKATKPQSLGLATQPVARPRKR